MSLQLGLENDETVVEPNRVAEVVFRIWGAAHENRRIVAFNPADGTTNRSCSDDLNVRRGV